MYAKGLERREAILDATLEAFSKLGYRGASLREIARELGMSSGNLHYYFASRDDLLAAVVVAWEQKNLGGGDYSIANLVRAAQQNSEYPGLIRLYSTLVVESSDPAHPNRGFITERYAALLADLSQDIAAQQAAGTVDGQLDPDRTARAIIAASDGLQMQWLHAPDFDLADELAYIARRLGLRV